jgi:Sulfotransferase family
MKKNTPPVVPIFILSLPRSGSTLLQRLLLASGECATLGEPSLLLRFLGHDDIVARKATYWEHLVDTAIEDIRGVWPKFDSVYNTGVRSLVESIYSGLADGKRFFVDKTPRYSLIAEEIYSVFPDAKYLILWRHPLAVATSMTKTSPRKFWFPDEFAIDLHAGMQRLFNFSKRHADHICQVRYEDLVTNQESELSRIGDYLGLTELQAVLKKPLPRSAGGGLGDPTGTKKYSAVSDQSLLTWQKEINNWYRRQWVRNYCSKEHVAMMNELGYDAVVHFESKSFAWDFVSGVKDLLLSSIRRRRRLKKPLQVARHIKKLQNQHGYYLSFR